MSVSLPARARTTSGSPTRVDAADRAAASPSRTADSVPAAREGRPKPDRGPSRPRPARRERKASDVVTDAWEGPPVVLRADGIECYSPSEWRRRFGQPPIAYGQISNDA